MSDERSRLIGDIRAGIADHNASLDEARQELERLRNLDPDRNSYDGSRDEMTTPRVVFEPAERRPMGDWESTHLISMTFKSRSENSMPHIVTRHFDGSVSCTCQAHNPCWGVKAFKQVAGIQ